MTGEAELHGHRGSYVHSPLFPLPSIVILRIKYIHTFIEYHQDLIQSSGLRSIGGNDTTNPQATIALNGICYICDFSNSLDVHRDGLTLPPRWSGLDFRIHRKPGGTRTGENVLSLS